MKKKITYTDESLGEVQIVEDFLPPPEHLALRVRQNTDKRLALTNALCEEVEDIANDAQGEFEAADTIRQLRMSHKKTGGP